MKYWKPKVRLGGQKTGKSKPGFAEIEINDILNLEQQKVKRAWIQMLVIYWLYNPRHITSSGLF